MFSDKYKAKIREGLNGQLKGNTILVVKEKHGTRYFDARNAPSFAMACLKLLKERRDKGYYDVEEPRVKEPAISEEQVKALDESSGIKLAAEREWYWYKNSWADYEEDRAMLVEVNKAIETEDGLLAYCVLRHRDNHEYEEVKLETLE